MFRNSHRPFAALSAGIFTNLLLGFFQFLSAPIFLVIGIICDFKIN